GFRLTPAGASVGRGERAGQPVSPGLEHVALLCCKPRGAATPTAGPHGVLGRGSCPSTAARRGRRERAASDAGSQRVNDGVTSLLFLSVLLPLTARVGQRWQAGCRGCDGR